MSHRLFKAYNAAEYFGGLTETQVSALNDDDLQLYHTAMQIGSGGVFLRDSAGNDWYTWQKTLADHTLKIAYNPTDGIVSHAAFDASALVPHNLAVAEIAADEIPGEYDRSGTVLRFIDDVLAIVPPDPVVLACTQLKRLQLEAEELIAPLARAVKYGMATDEEQRRLSAWEKYTVLLARVDLRAPEYPQKPD